jgi:hypothetical protein
VIELPEDGGMWHTVLVLDGGPASQRVAEMFNHTPRLQSLSQQTKFYQYGPDHFWTQKNRAGYPLPVILVMRPSIESGGTNDFVRVYEQWGSGIPADGERLADDIAKMVARPCPRPTPTPTPTPIPQPPPNNVPLIPMTPEEVQPPADQSRSFEWWMYAIIAGGGLFGGWRALKRE